MKRIDRDRAVWSVRRHDVIGGGSAVVSAAPMLGRACRSVLVVDGAEPRNALAEHMYGFPSQDGTAPLTFRELIRTGLAGYDVTVVEAAVRTTTATAAGFLVGFAGNLTNPGLNVLGAANAGDIAAGTINAELIAEDTFRAIRATRSVNITI